MSSLLALVGRDSEQLALRVQSEYEREVASLALPGLALSLRALDVVHVAPWLFSDITNGIDDDVRTDIAVSALLYRDYLLAFDKPIDGEAAVDALLLLAAGQWHERALTRLHRVVPNASALWGTLSKLARRQIAAAVDERVLRGMALRGSTYSFDAYAALAAAKSAILVAIPAACCAASNHERLVSSWDGVLDPFSIAVQLRDDITDWREDWNAGNLTLAHVRALEAGGLLQDFANGERPDAETVGHLLFHGGVASELLAESLDAYDASIEAACDWVRTIGRASRSMHDHCLRGWPTKSPNAVPAPMRPCCNRTRHKAFTLALRSWWWRWALSTSAATPRHHIACATRAMHRTYSYVANPIRLTGFMKVQCFIAPSLAGSTHWQSARNFTCHPV